jgi:starch synthase
VGGIPEVVVEGETGYLVPYTPDDPASFEAEFADRVNDLAANPSLAEAMCRAGRARAITSFDWAAIARQTVALYETLP